MNTVLCRKLELFLRPRRGLGYQNSTLIALIILHTKTLFSPLKIFFQSLFQWDFDAFAEGCKKQWGVTTRKYWSQSVYGGFNISASSNIVFRCVCCSIKCSSIIISIEQVCKPWTLTPHYMSIYVNVKTYFLVQLYKIVWTSAF